MPEWNFDGSGLWVTFLFKNDQKNDQKDVQKKLTERQKDILSLLSSDGTLTIEEMSKRLGISEKTIYRELSLLKANGHIERKGSKTKGEWVVKENI